MFEISNNKIAKLKESSWDFGNQILYNLCSNNFKHKDKEHILAKVLFIGRIYAAAVERRKIKDENINDNFYVDKIVPTFQDSEIDNLLEKIKSQKEITQENIPEILNVHHYLTQILKKITNLEKRSFSSKYLHFHLPELFFIYDSRAEIALKKLTNQVPVYLKKHTQLENVDLVYAKFLCKCYHAKKLLEEQSSTKITNRHFDNLLIDMANRSAIEKKKNSV